MKILIATPLFPPDTGITALYVKSLAERLSGEHKITILLYGSLPESIPNVQFVCVNKRTLLPTRLCKYLWLLWKESRKTDVIYIQNGPSVELPTAIIASFIKERLFFHIIDNAAHTYAQKHTARRLIENFLIQRAQKIIDDTPPQKPEILPFAAYPAKDFDEYERSWKNHLTSLVKSFEYEEK